MSKSVLVVDTPESCNKCNLIACTESFYYCSAVDTVIAIDIYEEKPKWCPLRTLPKKEYNNSLFDEYTDGYVDGWNRCLKKIIRGK